MYKLNPPGPFGNPPNITRLEDCARIPQAVGNPDFDAYLLWLEEGNMPEPADGPTLDEQKAFIDAETVIKLKAGVEWRGLRWHTDAEFQSQITSVISAFREGILPANYQYVCRTVDNENIACSLDDLKNIAGAMLMYVGAVYAEAWAAKDGLS